MATGQAPTKDWFEMHDLRTRLVGRATWTPLLFQGVTVEQGEAFHAGFLEEYVSVECILVPLDSREAALATSMDRPHHSHRPYADEKRYAPAGTVESFEPKWSGSLPVLVQHHGGSDQDEWHLHQDFVLGLKLKREDDRWLLPDEDYLEVARLVRNGVRSGAPLRLEARAEHVRDFLCAARCGLLVTTFVTRRAVLTDKPAFLFEPETRVSLPAGYWEGWFREIDERGMNYGSKAAIIKVSRTDADYTSDAPLPGPPTNTNVRVETWHRGSTGPRLCEVTGELRRREWIDPAPSSPRVRGDAEHARVEFVVSPAGERTAASDLIGDMRWLSFSPEIVTDILARRSGRLEWYSEDTGGLHLARESPLHFGVNDTGLLTIFAKDVGLLPEWFQRLLAARSVPPEGGVGRELMLSQMEATAADTVAPEVTLLEGLARLEAAFASRFPGAPLLLQHAETPRVIAALHRFQSVNKPGLFRLSKDVTRAIIDRLNEKILKTLTPECKPEAKSLTRLEAILNRDGVDGRRILGPLEGVRVLRQGDAHLPGSDLADALVLVGIDLGRGYLRSGKDLLSSVATALHEASAGIELQRG